MRIDLNSDMGESFGAYTIGHDAGLMESITSSNIAAGFHGGDPSVLRATIRLAKSKGVAVGAHPGFPDLVGFGRRNMDVTLQEAEVFVLYQIAALIRTIDEADRPGAEFERETLVAQADTLIMSAVAALEGKAEADMVRQLLRVRDSLTAQVPADRAEDVEGVKEGAMRAVNEYFERRLVDVPGIAAYIRELHEKEAAAGPA
jgi:lactam utilization protein B